MGAMLLSHHTPDGLTPTYEFAPLQMCYLMFASRERESGMGVIFASLQKVKNKAVSLPIDWYSESTLELTQGWWFRDLVN